MNCEQVKELLSAYLDNALAPEEQQTVATHLESCPECSHLFADFHHFDTLISLIPRISPDQTLCEKIFSSPEYLKLTATGRRADEQRILSKQILRENSDRPRLIALPGGRPPSALLELPTTHMPTKDQPLRQHWRTWGGLQIMQVAIAVSILLTIGMGIFIGWKLWLKQNQTAQISHGITPPASLQSGPIPAGTRFVFLRDGALWSSPADGGTGVLRLTPENVVVATNWVVRPALPGRPAGNMLAYIDLRQGFVHTIRSDGQNDTIIQQSLLKSDTRLPAIWNTDTGLTILNSLAWSKDGNTLAFVADPNGSGSPGLYIYSKESDTVQAVSLPMKGAVSHPIWSPDGIRIAFVLTLDRNVGILDYNTQNHGVLTITPAVNATAYPTDTVLSLDWSPNVDIPTLTWSVGVKGHVHSLWLQHVGIGGTGEPRALTTGDYVQATYSRAGHNSIGSWLLVTSLAGLPGDLISIDLTNTIEKLTNGKQVSLAQWSPDGQQIDYFDMLTDGVGALHVIHTTTLTDTLVATSVTAEPAPVWSSNGEHIAYSTGTHVLFIDTQILKASQPLKLQGPASAFSWSAISPDQLVLAMSDGQPGIYLVDTQHETSLQLDKNTLHGPIVWTQIP